MPCVYSHKHDGRRTASKQYVQALEHRVKQLEAQLQRRNAEGTEVKGDSGTDGGIAAVRLRQSSLPPDRDGSPAALTDDMEFGAEDPEEEIGSLRVVNE
jgi:hypothetical protein